jgi:hypothetical protein
MASKKQRRRRAKEQRHDYVWVDEEGNELDPKEAQADSRTAAKPASSRRDPQEPSWPRTLRRGAIFAPIMFATVFLLSPELSLANKITQTALIVAIFIPFSYFLDRLFYRSAQRRAARRGQTSGRSGS